MSPVEKIFLVLLVARQSIVARVNSILGTYCQGFCAKKGDKIQAGASYQTPCPRMTPCIAYCILNRSHKIFNTHTLHSTLCLCKLHIIGITCKQYPCTTHMYVTYLYLLLSNKLIYFTHLSLIHIPSPRDRQKSRMPSSA